MTTVDPLTTLANLRDVASAHPSLATGVFLRSDAPLATDRHDGYPVVWPPRTVLDLRDAGEQGNDVHPLAAHCDVVPLPLLRGAAYDVDGLPPTLGALYLTMLDSAHDMLVDVVRLVATAPGPVLVHCAAGKDRTGVAVALVLSLLGTSRESIVADYTATDANMAGVNARMLQSNHVVARVADIDLEALPADLSRAPVDAIAAVLDALETHPDGAEGWYLARGGDADTLSRLRSRFLG
ncbi:tyrosine-protein phosphatase [Rhodococcus sp. HNM0569]|uniref:tyrosine-protein phosphatase n=1 Tax=Rhodococcus sp. HNM0569 TaxID=2716340 RepID=UPI00146C1E3F|nr:tyrosine-protein phosphatase [Rhodococcus sp. HNM0569]NLU81196.1 tyrosine-protein phosphatase [Rhodococcus sp. HNM0569]